MKERPILFSSPMVRALLAGTKTQTRRVMNPQPWFDPNWGTLVGMNGAWIYGNQSDRGDQWAHHLDADMQRRACTEEAYGWGARSGCPYGVAGDHLWVKETWHPSARIGADLVEIEYRADELTRELHPPGDFMWERWDDKWIRGGWRPSLFMSRWMSRLTLEVTEVRVQRVQDISDEDARAEGIDGKAMSEHAPVQAEMDARPAKAFALLWNSINGKRPGCAWADNPWVFAISFRRVQP